MSDMAVQPGGFEPPEVTINMPQVAPLLAALQLEQDEGVPMDVVGQLVEFVRGLTTNGDLDPELREVAHRLIRKWDGDR